MCPLGFFGLSCAQECHCEDLCPCDPQTGTCNATLQGETNYTIHRGRTPLNINIIQQMFVFMLLSAGAVLHFLHGLPFNQRRVICIKSNRDPSVLFRLSKQSKAIPSGRTGNVSHLHISFLKLSSSLNKTELYSESPLNCSV